MIILRNVERFERLECRHDGIAEDTSLVQLPDVRFGHAFLFVILIENCRAILAAHVVALLIELRRIMRYGKVNLE